MALRIDIASPCSQDWAQMEGDERARFCAACQQHVFNVASLTEPEVLALLAENGGGACGRVLRRKDGTVLLKDCPAGLARARRAMGFAVLTAASLLVTFSLQRSVTNGFADAVDDSPEGTVSSALRQSVEQRVVAGREYLRGTPLFGPLVDRLYPQRHVVVGRMLALPPSGAGSHE